MAKLITKFKYLKPNARQSVGGYAKYIATREGVDKIDDRAFRNKPVTDGGVSISGQEQAQNESNEPRQTAPKKSGDRKGGSGMNPVPPSRRTTPVQKPEVAANEPS